MPLALAGAALAVPWLWGKAPVLALALDRGFAVVCHQRPERSFALLGGSVAVCARCLGIYVGAAAGLLLRVPWHFALRLLLTAVVISGADWLAAVGGLHGNLMLLRFGLGFLLGAAISLLITSQAADAARLATVGTS